MLIPRCSLSRLLALAALTGYFISSAGAEEDSLPQRFSTGLTFDEGKYRSIPYKAPVTAETYANLPRAYSLKKYCPTPGNQGPHGTCVGFAAGYSLRTILYAIEKQMTNRRQIDQNVFSPTFVYEQIRKVRPDPNCEEGTGIGDAVQLMRDIGIPKNRDVPYQCGTTIDSSDLLKATEYPIADFQVLFGSNLEPGDPIKTLATKKALSEGSPILLGFLVYDSFHERGKPVWRKTESDLVQSDEHGFHAMTVVGYDDDKFGGAFLIMNSWGTGWGDNGFIWVPYHDYAVNAFAAIQAYGKQPQPEPFRNNVYQPPEIPLLLAGKVSFQERDGSPMPAIKVVEDGVDASGARFEGYRLARAYAAGTRFRFFVTTNSRAYLYAFATDLTGKITQILPYEDGMSPMIGRDSTIAFPSERKVVRMDNEPGRDYLLMLYSDEPLQMDALLESMNSYEGTLSVKLANALGKRIIPQSNIQYDAEGIGFAVQQKTAAHVVPLMVEIVRK
jgi:hypothetical protein